MSNNKVDVNIYGAVLGNAAGVAIANSAAGSSLTINPGGILGGGCTGGSPADCNSDGYALLGMNQQAHVTAINNGTVIGSLDPAPNTVTFNNYGKYFSGREITHIDFNDYGTTYLGQQPGKILDVTMTGVNYRYSNNAMLIVDADFVHGIPDKLHLVGSTFQRVTSKAFGTSPAAGRPPPNSRCPIPLPVWTTPMPSTTSVSCRA
ncbi:MAG: hypothetical protein NTX45_28255 [Proteobacteria bacterium]|nr:hypothetical protein [Pseudomonadota bacterium]